MCSNSQKAQDIFHNLPCSPIPNPLPRLFRHLDSAWTVLLRHLHSAWSVLTMVMSARPWLAACCVAKNLASLMCASTSPSATVKSGSSSRNSFSEMLSYILRLERFLLLGGWGLLASPSAPRTPQGLFSTPWSHPKL